MGASHKAVRKRAFDESTEGLHEVAQLHLVVDVTDL